MSLQKKILVTGANGQLGNCLRRLEDQYNLNYEFVFASSSDLDITNDQEVDHFFENLNPDFCINAAAYTAVDAAESDNDNAFAVNAYGVENLAKSCKKTNCTFIHVSTDYVFNGETNISYDEDNFTDPQGVYGLSKRKGEELALDEYSNTIIIRTSWLYSEFNKNFVKTMLNLFDIKDELNIVADQFGQPTNANDLAEAIMKIIETENKHYGIFHFSNYPETTWFDFASEIANLTESNIKLNPITTDQYPTPAKRPYRSTMSLDKIESLYNIDIKRWEESLAECIDILKTQNEN